MKSYLTIIFLFLTSLLFAQINLVPNPSFEEYDTCPNNLNQTHYLLSWEDMWNSSSDYYNSCSTNIHSSIPNNFMGFQFPDDGNAYIGLFTHGAGVTNYREYVGCALINNLEIGQKYFLSLKVNAANSNQCFTNNIGIQFSNHNYSQITNFSHLYSIDIINDTLNWVTINGSFIADSAYQYLIIGNFFDDQNTDTLMLGLNSSSYYNIDQVCVSTDSLFCNSSNSINGNNIVEKALNYYPNPAQDEITVNYKLKSDSYFVIFDILGAKRKVFKLDIDSNNKKINLSELNNGLYVFAVLDKHGVIIEFGKLNIQK